MADLTAHQQRVKKELAAVGMTNYGQHKMSSRYLPNIIAEGEHIKGVVYGHSGVGLATLVATDRRIIYLEKRPFFISTDEVSYEVVVGVRYIKAGLFPAVELHTRMGNYTITYVSSTCSTEFVKYIESRIEHLALDHTDEPRSTYDESPEPPMPVPPRSKPLFDTSARDFLSSHETAVLSTTDRTGSVQGVTVYYLFGENDKFYIITKSDTAKAHNMLASHQVALTIFDGEEARTAQIQGYAEIEADTQTKYTIFQRLVRPRNYGGEEMAPPVTQLEKGGFIAFRITPFNARYTDYKQSDQIISSERST